MHIKTIVIIVSYILFALIIGLSFWVGYKRGVKRSAISLGISLALIVIAFLITPPISNAILNIKVNSAGDSKPLSQLIIDILSEQPQIKTAIENSPTLRSFIEALPLVVMNVVVYLVLYSIMRLIGYIIYKIIEVTCLKSKQKEKELGLKRNGWAGGALSVVKTLIFIFLSLAPLNALLGLINDMETKTKPAYTASSSSNSSSIPSTEEILSNIPPVVTDGINAYENNVFGFLGSWFGLDNFVFDNLVKIKVDGEEINIRQDALSYAIVYNTYVEMSKAVSNPADESFVNVDWTRLDQSVNYIFESGLVRGVVANLFADFVKNYQEFEINFGQAQEILDCLKASIEDKNVKDYFTNDLKQIYEAFSTAGKSGVLDTLLLDKTSSSTDKFEEIISIKNKDALKMVLSSALNMNIVKDAFSPILKLAVNQINSDKFDFSNSSTNVQNWEEFKKTILTSVDDLAEINSTLPLSTIVSQPVEILKLTKEKLSLLLSKTGSLLDNINNSGILVDEKGTKVLDKIFEDTINNCYSDFRWLDTYTIDDKGQRFNITDFIKCFQETFDEIGYTGDARNIGRAGLVRLKSLVNLFDNYFSIPIEDMLTKPTIIELAAIENSDQKALIIALLLLSILAYVNANYVGEGGLRNFILLEEAHVLLDTSSGGGEGAANPTAIAQGLVKRMLAEIRSYGVGLAIADQSPRKVGIDIVALTDIKVAFRLVEGQDKQILADSTSMSDIQVSRLAKLKPGEAFLFFNRLDEPEEIITPNYRMENKISISLSDESIKELSAYWKDKQDKLRPYPECQLCPYCKESCDYNRRVLAKEVARRIFNKHIKAGAKDIEKVVFVFSKIISLIVSELNDETFDRPLLSCVKVHLWRRIKYETNIRIAEGTIQKSLIKE